MGTGDDATTENEYVGSFCIDRKIDLTNYMKWWGSNKTRTIDSHVKTSEENKHGCSEDIGSELISLERATQPTEPYQMPRLGVSEEGKKHNASPVSAMSILSRSAAYKNLQEKASKKEEMNTGSDEKENKSNINKMDYGKEVEKSSSHDGLNERHGVALGMGAGGLPLQRNMYPLAPFLSAPLLTSYNSLDPLADPILWTSLVPVLSGGSRPVEIPKTETSSDYPFFQEED